MTRGILSGEGKLDAAMPSSMVPTSTPALYNVVLPNCSGLTVIGCMSPADPGAFGGDNHQRCVAGRLGSAARLAVAAGVVATSSGGV